MRALKSAYGVEMTALTLTGFVNLGELLDLPRICVKSLAKRLPHSPEKHQLLK